MPGISIMGWILIAIVAIMLFGENLPNAAREFGRRYAAFRKQLSDMQQQFNVHEIINPITNPLSTTTTSSPRRISYDADDRDEASAPKFVPPPAESPGEK